MNGREGHIMAQNAMTMLTALTISDDKPIENIQNVSRIAQMKISSTLAWRFFVVFLLCFVANISFSI